MTKQRIGDLLKARTQSLRQHTRGRVSTALVAVIILAVCGALTWRAMHPPQRDVPPLTIPTTIPSDSPQTCPHIADTSAQALLGYYAEDLTFRSSTYGSDEYMYRACTVTNPLGNFLVVAYGSMRHYDPWAFTIAVPHNEASSPVELDEVFPGYGYVASNRRDAEIVYECDGERFVAVSVYGYVRNSPVEENLINFVAALLPTACTPPTTAPTEPEDTP